MASATPCSLFAPPGAYASAAFISTGREPTTGAAVGIGPSWPEFGSGYDMVTTDISAPASPSQRRGAVHVTAAQMGAIGGVLAVVAGAVFAVRPPEVYGLCMACHARDLVNWTINDLAGTHLTVAPASLVFPVLTTVGVLVGALLGAMLSGEFRWRSVENSLHMFVYGALVMMFALLAGGCAI